jgi:AcrR family transcriptional regulator
MREAARKAGVSHQAPYHHFTDREAILAAIAGEGFVKLGQALMRAAADAGVDAGKAVEAMGRAYIDFAMRHPAYFQVMFRADAVPLERYPEARKQEDEAFGTLVEGIDQAFAKEPPEARQRIAIAAWALVHGLATLILEGSLARKVGVPKARQKQLADEVIETFLSLVERRRA